MPLIQKVTLYIALILSAAILSSCGDDDPKDEIRQALAELVTAVENKKHRSVTYKLTKDFRGNRRLDQRTMSALIFRYYLRHKFIKIYTLINSIEILPHSENEPLQAKMDFHAALTSTKSVLPEHMRVFKITAFWIKKERDWIMSKASWVEVRPQSVYPQFKDQMVKNVN